MDSIDSINAYRIISGDTSFDAAVSILVSIALLLSSTYLVTSCRFYIGRLRDRRFKEKEPLTIPYWIPFLGNSLSMVSNAHAFYEVAMKSSGGDIIGARLGPMYVYFIGGAKNVQTVFRNSRSLTSDFLVLQVIKKVIGVTGRDAAIWENDKSGHHATPLSNIPEDERIWRHTHESQSRILQSGEELKILTKVFTEEMFRLVDEEPLDEWQTVPIYRHFRDKMANASTISIIGRGVFRYNPKMIEDFWIFNDGLTKLFFGIPRFLVPKISDARDRLRNACIKVLENLDEEYDSLQASDPDWHEILGSRVNRLRDKAAHDSGISIKGRGSLLAGFLIGINGNAIPIAGWMMIEITQDPDLLSALRQEIQTAVVRKDTVKGGIVFDVPALLSLPFLSSAFTETLRLRVSTTPTRQILKDLEVDGYVLKAGKVVMLPSWPAHTNDEWSTPDHSATTFWAGRFLPENNSKGDKKAASASSLLKSGRYFPFGGGTSICPGRFFAKQEVLIAVAIMILKFDIEFVKFIGHDGSDSDRGPETDTKNAGAGAVSPDRDLLVRLKRRL